ncbi:hypothetical protein GN244_ATG08165 [Phytophthora infestans]|uniref:FYVE-type domain-containing protein n=1 Tax=Phytophthora infestans TaxID=4787 RepID=A0A833TEM9_PHYIN|nr:hypothetical protein GN244_ATG08165 [Phytophthora infestans]KAF4130844.1 hypothetical protein GN958_ATG19973 [Phytophthora infestans]
MKFTLPKNAFPQVVLSANQQAALAEQADTVVKEIVAANEAFITDGCTLGHPLWKLVRTKEGLKVYRQRKKAINQRGSDSGSPILQSPSWSKEHEYSRYRTLSSSSVDFRATSLSSSSGVAGDSIMEKMRPHGVALMALHGSMDGSLDDCMFGCFASTDEAWKLRSSHINDRLDDARILATVRGPTRDDPCRFLGVKWFAKEHPVVLTGIVQQRDFLITESSGFTRDSKGERVGYFLMHSVTLRDIPELTHLGIVRGVMSFCYLFRQGRPGMIDVFCRGFFDSRGDMPGRLSVSIAAEAAICCTGVVDCAYVKKLRWLMEHASKRQADDEDHTNVSRCEACDKSFSKFSLTSSGSGTPCAICRQVVCSKCSVTKKITMDVSDTGAVQQCSLHFCMSCLLKAKKQSGWEMAMSNLEASSASVDSASAASAPRIPPNVDYRRDGRSYSAYTGSRTYRREEMTSTTIRTNDLYRSTSDQTNVESRASNAKVQSWSSCSTGPKSVRGVRLNNDM